MLHKIISIKNVGRFRNCNATGDVSFRKTTLIYAPNGRGKTTFCDICRSLKTGLVDIVLGRASLGAGAEPSIEFLFDTGPIRFKSGKWSSAFPDFAIFDSRFIYDNVYAGECVEHDQRRNLYDVIIGEKGVVLRRDVDSLDDSFRAAGQELSQKEASLRVFIPGGLSIDAFVALQDVIDIDAKLEAKAKEVTALESAAELKAKPGLTKITLPTFPTDLDALLSKTLANISDDAEAAINRHMAEHMQRPHEQWLVEGLALLKDDACPFCAQSVTGNPLIALYRSHFAGEYEKLKAEIQAMTTRVGSFADQGTILAVERTATENTTRLTGWQVYIAAPQSPTLDVPLIQDALTAMRSAALTLLAAKASNPLDAVTSREDYKAALEGIVHTASLVDSYNLGVDALNGTIAAKKEAVEAGDLAKTRRDLDLLRATKARQRDDVKTSVDEFRAARTQRTTIDQDKLKAKTALEDYSRDIFQRYQSRINTLLRHFGATFRIEKAREHYPGGKPSSTYCLVIDDNEVELGDAKTPVGKPSFKNTLSAGDKSALALAFFLAQLSESVDVSQKIVILDDPFTSQDSSRQTCTEQEIRRLASEARQVIVLSHDRRFLKRVWDSVEHGGTKTLQFSPLGDTTVTEWDIETVLDEYVGLYTTLWLYCNRNEGDPQLVVRTIRLVLEGYLRMKLPRDFLPDKWLGDYVKQIAEADAGTTVALATGLLPELQDLKDYAKRYHHPHGGEAADDPVDPVEVLAYGQRALKLVEAF